MSSRMHNDEEGAAIAEKEEQEQIEAENTLAEAKAWA